MALNLVEVERRGGAAMEGRGSYNSNSLPQQVAAGIGHRLMARAAAELELPYPAEPLVIADYGSAEGRNSMAPIRAALDTLRRRGSTAVSVVHVDRPANDFASLFGLVRQSPESYLAGQENVFAFAAGGSFYDRLFPAEQVSLGWCSIALHWLSALPAHGAGELWPQHVTGAARAPFVRQADADWRAFLRHRAAELRPGGRLVVVVPAVDEAGGWGIQELAHLINSCLREMVKSATLRAAELQRMMIPVYNRSRAELEAPFADPGLGLVIETLRLDHVADPLWAAFVASGDPMVLAHGHAGFVRAAFGPTLANGLDPDRSAGERAAFVSELEARLRRRTLADPAARCNPVIVTMLIAKPARPRLGVSR